MRDYEALDVDESELADMPPLGVFMLGYELGRIDQRLRGRNGFEETVTAANAKRIEEACIRRGRSCGITWLRDDPGEEWVRLVVYPRP